VCSDTARPTARWPLVPLSAIEHYEYCPRQCALIHCDGVWHDNVNTLRGHIAHRRSDDPSESRVERGRTVLRGVRLWSDRHGLTGRADRIEVTHDGAVTPVEHKAGQRHGATADLQVCAQALCLEEMLNIDIATGVVWYDGTRRRRRVRFSDTLRTDTLARAEQIRTTLIDGTLPAAPNDERCRRCQLRHHCLPELTSRPAAVTDLIAKLLRA